MGRSTMHNACNLACIVSINPPARWVLLSHFTNEEAQRHALTCSRSHSCKCWHEIQTQLCLPALGSSSHKYTQQTSLAQSWGGGGVERGRAGVMGSGGYAQGPRGKQVWSSLLEEVS